VRLDRVDRDWLVEALAEEGGEEVGGELAVEAEGVAAEDPA